MRQSQTIVALTRKYARFESDETCEKGFQELKRGLTVIPMLGYPDLSKDYILYVDASQTAVREVLCQECDEIESVAPGIKSEKAVVFSITQIK